MAAAWGHWITEILWCLTIVRGCTAACQRAEEPAHFGEIREAEAKSDTGKEKATFIQCNYLHSKDWLTD